MAGNFMCPLCKKSMVDKDAMEEEMDLLVAMNPMPKLFEKTTAQIFCNDCNKESKVPFNFVGHKCPHCRSYNTSKLALFDVPSEKEIELFEKSEREKEKENAQNNEGEGNGDDGEGDDSDEDDYCFGYEDDEDDDDSEDEEEIEDDNDSEDNKSDESEDSNNDENENNNKNDDK